ncbi:TerB family tellurite resistance protein [Mangrovimonas aestuarii]|uniref:TerB family tellurite resistance protein n=1 Tax=Mangrovimonas aestuarii TaxID=3018443 RepID=UPI00237948E2|nr:TerB family tellurite resistance protein [Mangrovimonas aestuarii]
MSISKWLGATLGWSFGGPIGAILGFALGSVVDGMTKENAKEFKRTYREHVQTGSGDFEVSLLILSAIVIKADGKQDQRELDFVRQQFVGMYGKERANHAFKLFKSISQQNNISTRQVCVQIRQRMDHPSRLQLLHFLFGIAKADGSVSEAEVSVIQTISHYLGINPRDFDSIKAMFYGNGEASYTILEIDKNATNEEVKAAYRKMVKKYHPDKVTHLGPEHQKGAEEKFRRVQEAYEHIQKERGF